MPTYRAISDNVVGGEADVKQRITVAAVDVALDVYAEVGTTPGHAARAAFATKLLNAPEAYTIPLSYAVGIKAANTLDASLKTAVASVWNAFAGA